MTNYNLSPASPPVVLLKPARSPEIRNANQEPQQRRKRPAGSGLFRPSPFGLPSTFGLRTSGSGPWTVDYALWTVWCCRPAPCKANPTKSNPIQPNQTEIDQILGSGAGAEVVPCAATQAPPSRIGTAWRAERPGPVRWGLSPTGWEIIPSSVGCRGGSESNRFSPVRN
jgi:hypothetical protein